MADIEQEERAIKAIQRQIDAYALIEQGGTRQLGRELMPDEEDKREELQNEILPARVEKKTQLEHQLKMLDKGIENGIA